MPCSMPFEQTTTGTSALRFRASLPITPRMCCAGTTASIASLFAGFDEIVRRADRWMQANTRQENAVDVAGIDVVDDLWLAGP